jgi:tRNA(Ile2) C34 agmatinyltransferase TiaS
MMWSAARMAEVFSSITTSIYPECGGRMGGRGKKFKCQGSCQKDWRETWERRYSIRRGHKPPVLLACRRTHL